MSRSNIPALAALALLLVSGCGEEAGRTSFKDADEPPPLSADAEAGIRAQDRAVEDAERAEGASIPASAPRGRKR